MKRNAAEINVSFICGLRSISDNRAGEAAHKWRTRQGGGCRKAMNAAKRRKHDATKLDEHYSEI